MKCCLRWVCALGLLVGSGTQAAPAGVLEFTLLTWDAARATVELPAAVGRKPSAPAPGSGDWLIFTADDLLISHNPAGALSHNFVDLAGLGGAQFNLAPSLAGTLTLEVGVNDGTEWSVAVTALAFEGQAAPGMQMNQSLVTAGSAAAANPLFVADGLGNAGTWHPTASGNYVIQYAMDFAFATNADGDPNPYDVDLAFNDKQQSGYLIPVSQLTAEGLASVSLDDPAGFFGGDFEQYLLAEIAPRLPADATYLLVTQMAKVHPDYAEPGLPVTTAGLIGNTTIAYTTGVVPEPGSALAMVAMIGLGLLAAGRHAARQ